MIILSELSLDRLTAFDKSSVAAEPKLFSLFLYLFSFFRPFFDEDGLFLEFLKKKHLNSAIYFAFEKQPVLQN